MVQLQENHSMPDAARGALADAGERAGQASQRVAGLAGRWTHRVAEQAPQTAQAARKQGARAVHAVDAHRRVAAVCAAAAATVGGTTAVLARRRAKARRSGLRGLMRRYGHR
jgi:hypothetical protein